MNSCRRKLYKKNSKVEEDTREIHAGDKALRLTFVAEMRAHGGAQ